MEKKKCFPELSQPNLLYIIKELFILGIFGISDYEMAQEYGEIISH